MCLLQFDLTRISNTAYKVLSDELSKMHNVIFDQRCCSIHACIKLLIEYELSAALRGMWSELVSMWHTPQCWLGWGTLPSLLWGRGADRLPFEKGTLVCLVSAKAFFLDLLGKWRGCWYMLIWFFVHWKKRKKEEKGNPFSFVSMSWRDSLDSCSCFEECVDNTYKILICLCTAYVCLCLFFMCSCALECVSLFVCLTVCSFPCIYKYQSEKEREGDRECVCAE